MTTEMMFSIQHYDTSQPLRYLWTNDPSVRARCIHLNYSNIITGKSTSALTDEDIKQVYEDLDEAICQCEAEEIDLKAFINEMVNRFKEEGGKDLVKTVRDLLFLAWRVNQGISCFHHADPRSRPPIHIQEKLSSHRVVGQYRKEVRIRVVFQPSR